MVISHEIKLVKKDPVNYMDDITPILIAMSKY